MKRSKFSFICRLSSVAFLIFCFMIHVQTIVHFFGGEGGFLFGFIVKQMHNHSVNVWIIVK